MLGIYSVLRLVSVRSRLLVLVSAVSVIFLGFAIYSNLNLRHELIQERTKKVSSVVGLGSQVVDYFVALEKAGILTQEEAQNHALELLETLRYDGVQYFWVNDQAGKVLMHGGDSSLVGQEMTGLVDARGERFFANVLRMVARDGSGNFQYYWPPNEDAELKISHASLNEDWGWITASGVFLTEALETYYEALEFDIILMVCVLLGIALVAMGISRSISLPLSHLTGTMGQISRGKLDEEIEGADFDDEIGQMASNLLKFRDDAQRIRTMEQERVEAEKNAEEQRQAALRKMADSFEDSVREVLQSVTAASTELLASATQMKGTARRTSSLATNVATAAGQASANVQTVAAATEQLNSSIEEISRQVGRSSEVAENAVANAMSTTDTVSSLRGDVGKVGEIVNLINDIADQTNLLALNATIEAARAGDAGKGFAVVANEVKNLASQTGKATQDISDRISAIQKGTEQAVQAIQDISGIISRMHEISTSVASAVQEQSAATNEISRNIDQASSGTNEVTENIHDVEEAASETGAAAEQIEQSAGGLSEQSNRLSKAVDDFLATVRSDKKQMSNIKWDDSLNTGFTSVDNHHREAFEELNRLYNTMLSGNAGSQISEMVANLSGRLKQHFADEEKEMQRLGYPGLEKHRANHRFFLQQFEDRKLSVNSGKADAGYELLNFCYEYMKVHIKEEDMALANFIRHRQAA